MEFFRFVFSSFWTWLGVLLLLCAALGGTAEIIKAFRRGRKVEAYRIGDRWHIVVENASREDVAAAMYAPDAILDGGEGAENE